MFSFQLPPLPCCRSLHAGNCFSVNLGPQSISDRIIHLEKAVDHLFDFGRIRTWKILERTVVLLAVLASGDDQTQKENDCSISPRQAHFGPSVCKRSL